MGETIPYTYYFDYSEYHKGSKAGIQDVVTIEVSPIWHHILTTFDKLEKNKNRAETRRHVSYEKLEQLDDFLIPKQLYSDENSPERLLVNKEISDAYYDLYYKIHCAMNFTLFTEKQYYACFYRLLSEVSFEEVAYFLRFHFYRKVSVNAAKQHYYKAADKLRKKFSDDYKKLLELEKNS